ncbi:MAG: polysaccharide deacetylase family protein [Spirochaetota bacterium]
MGAFDTMKKRDNFTFTPFHITGIIAILLSVVLLFKSAMLALAPLAVFALICAVAPFMTGFGFFLPVISRGLAGKNAVALTFDDGPSDDVTPAVLKLLSKYSAKATFFVTGENASRHPEIIRKILKQGHLIGNHSFKHDPLLMLRTRKTLFNEISECQNILQKFKITPCAFRPPAGITNPRLRGVLAELGLFCVNWSCRGFDAGNRNVKGLSDKILKKVKPGDIILLHDVNPGSSDSEKKILAEFEKLLKGLRNSGLNIVPLPELIEKDVMK